MTQNDQYIVYKKTHKHMDEIYFAQNKVLWLKIINAEKCIW